MVQMSWEKFIGMTNYRGVDRIRIRTEGIFFSRKAFQRLGEPKQIHIYYDDKKKAIKIMKAKKDIKIRKYSNSIIAFVNISRIMPIGVYVSNERGYFILDS